jgi:hypothetical protein
MKRNVQLSLVLVVAAVTQAHAARAQSLCAKDETTYFSCPASNGRSINLCGKSAQTLQYRFGKPGRVELAFPARPEDGADAFRYAHYSRSQVDRFELRFDNAGAEYVLFDYTESGQREAGVGVTQGGKEISVSCRRPVRSRLGELEGKLKCDTDSALTGGACR